MLEWMIQVHLSACGYSTVPASFVEKLILFPLNGLGNLDENQVTMGGFLVSLFYCTGLYVCHYAAAAKSLQSCRTLFDPIDGSPPGSPVPGILQARTLEWVAISFSNA